MKKLLPSLSLVLLLVACVDTTGISPNSTKVPRGNANSAVVVTEFADLECPACRAASTSVVQPLVQKYGAQVRFDWVNFPLRSIHRYTMELSEAAECAADQGKFWDYVDAAFEKQNDLKAGAAQVWGEALVPDKDLFSRCVRSHIKKDAILAEYDAGVAAGVRGTPTFFVNGKQIDASVAALSAEIEAQIKGAKAKL